MIFEFLFGMLAAYIYHKKNIRKYFGLLLALVGFLMLALSLAFEVYYFDFYRVFIWGFPSFFIVLGVVCSYQIKNSFLSYLGDASYSIYLFQVLAIPAFYKLMRIYSIDWSADALAIICLFFCVFFGCFVFSFVEKPIAQGLNRLVNINLAFYSR